MIAWLRGLPWYPGPIVAGGLGVLALALFVNAWVSGRGIERAEKRAAEFEKRAMELAIRADELGKLAEEQKNVIRLLEEKDAIQESRVGAARGKTAVRVQEVMVDADSCDRLRAIAQQLHALGIRPSAEIQCPGSGR